MSYQFLKFEQTGNCGVLTIDRAQALNALNEDLINELFQFFQEPPANLKALVLTGAGKAFVAGADIKAFQNLTSQQAVELSKKGQRLLSIIEMSPFPVIAAVNGFALGGGLELALACDFIVASSTAKLGLPEVGLGLIPGYGGTQRLARQIGTSLAKAITFSGEIFTAEQFYNWGLIVEITTPDSLLEKSQWWASKISEKSSAAVKAAKFSIMKGFDLTQSDGMNEEAKLFGECFGSSDQKEGVMAFLEKRKPKFV